MAVTERRRVVALLLPVASLLVSFAFAVLGFGVAFADRAPTVFALFGMTMLVYGVASAGLLLLAWWRGSRGAMRAMHWLAPGVVLSMALFSLDLGRVSGLELAGILLVAALAWLNWFTLRLVLKWRASA